MNNSHSIEWFFYVHKKGHDMNSQQKEKLAKLLMQGVDSALMYRMIESFIENDIEGKGKSKYAPERDIDTVQTGGDAYRENYV